MHIPTHFEELSHGVVIAVAESVPEMSQLLFERIERHAQG